MAKKKISELPAITTPTTGDLVPVVQSGVTDKMTRGNFLKNIDADATLTDITTNDASTSKHGFLKKLDNNAAHFMDGQGNWSTPSGVTDASGLTYTPAVNADWDGSADPGNADDALDQLAARVTDVEGAIAGGGGDASSVTYTPASNADWSGSADPGNVDDALDQLADRVDTLEAGGGGASLSPEHIFEFDDFLNDPNDLTKSKFQYFFGSNPSLLTPVANHPGIIRLSSTGGNTMRWVNTAGHQFLPADMFVMTFIVRPNGHANAAFYAGAWGSISFTPNDAIWIEGLSTDTNWFLVTRSGGSQTRVDTGIAISNNTWYKFKIYRKDASTIAAIVNGGSEVTSTTNIPTNALDMWMGLNVSSGTQTWDIDLWIFEDVVSARF